MTTKTATAAKIAATVAEKFDEAATAADAALDAALAQGAHTSETSAALVRARRLARMYQQVASYDATARRHSGIMMDLEAKTNRVNAKIARANR